MGAIFKRELQAHLTNLFGWIFIAISIGLIGFSVILTNLVGAVPQAEYSIRTLLMAMVLTVPFLCMPVFASENKSGNIKFLLSLPIKTHHIVLGKFFAVLAVFAIPTLILAIMPLLLSLYGTVLLSQSYVSILAYFLIGACMIAICMFIGAHSRRLIVTLAVGVLVCAVLYAGPVLSAFVPTSPMASLISIIALELVICLVIWLLSKRLTVGGAAFGIFAIPTLIAYLISPNSFSSLFRKIVSFLSPFERISNFTLGIFDLEDIIYLLSVAALFVFLTYRAIEKTRSTSKREGLRSISVTAISLALVITINLGIFAIPSALISFDASGLDIYSLSDASKEFAAEADEDTTIYLLSEQGIPDAQIEQILLEYEAASAHIDYKLINVTSNPDFVAKYIGVSYYHTNSNGIRPLSNHSVIIESAKRYTVINSANYYSYKVGSYTYTEDEFLALCQQAVSEGYDISQIGYETFLNVDKVILSGIEYVLLDNVSTVFTLKGHGERDISESFYSNIKQSGAGSYDEIILDNFKSVPDYCSTLIISSPTTDISADDANKIIEYIDRGGDIILITSPENTKMPNLLRVAEKFGLAAGDGVIRDSDKKHHMNDDPSYLILDSNPEHPVSSFVHTNYFSQDSDIYARFPNAHPIVKTELSDDSLVIKEMFTTSEKATASDKDAAKKLVAAYSAEKTIDKDAENTANLFWFSSYEAFSEKTSKAHPINTVYLLVSLSYMGGVQDFETSLDVPPRNISGAFLKIPQSIPVVWGITFGLIVLIILFSGVALYVSRRARKRF